MRYIDNIDKILDEHEKWLKSYPDGDSHDTPPADFANCAICRFDFTGRDLSYANFTGARIQNCIFDKAILCDAVFLDAVIVESSFRNSNCAHTDMRCTTISDCNVENSNLQSSCFIGARIYYTRFVDSNLSNIDFAGAKFIDGSIIRAKMYNSCIEHAFFSNVIMKIEEELPFVGMKCPSEGSFIAWKVCRYNKKKVIVKLLIPEDAKRTSFTTLKCRADKAVVLEIQDANGNKLNVKKARSMHDKSFVYEVGKTVTPKYKFNEARYEECTSGIHFFVDREAALTLM